MEYLVQCGAGELAFYNVTDLSLQSEEDCVDDEGNARYTLQKWKGYCSTIL